MQNDRWYILKVAGIYVTTIIGAGFASGQEIVQFFASYYNGGFVGILFSGLLFALIGAIVLNKVYSDRIKNYDEFIFPIFGWFFGWLIQILVTLFMISLFSIMVAGASNIISDNTGLSYTLSAILMGLICLIIILTSIRGVVMISAILTPFLIVGIILAGIYIIIFKDTAVFDITGYFSTVTKNNIFSSLLYVSYNSLMSIVIMCNLLPYLKSRNIAIKGGLLGGALLGIVAFIINWAIYIFYPEVSQAQLPIIEILHKYSGIAKVLYTFVLFLAMLISAVTSGFCVVDRISSKIKISPKIVALLLCILAVPMSSLGFSGLIATIYPVFGYLGLFIIFALLIQFVKGLFEPRRLRRY